jgi:uncharacterized membrane protein
MPEVIDSPIHRSPSYLYPRGVNILLGVWLFISAFAWAHSRPQFTSTWVLGVICVAAAIIALSVSWFRYVNTALAILLFILAFALRPVSAGTTWNNALVAIAIFVFSLLPDTGRVGVSSPRRRVPA